MESMMMSVRPGGLVRPAALSLLAMIAGQASGQDFTWANASSGSWETAGAWTPSGVPGASVLDTATLGFGTAYSVFVNASRTISALDLQNELAAVEIFSGTLTVRSAITGPGQVIIGDGVSNTTTRLGLAANATTASDVVLRGVNAGRAGFVGPANGAPALVTPAATISGTGFLDGLIRFEGTVRAGEFDRVEFFLDNAVITGGGVLEQIGQFEWNTHTIEGMTLRGEPKVLPGDSLVIGSGVIVEDPIRVADVAVNSTSILFVSDGAVLDATVQLDNPSRAGLSGPTAPSSRGTLGSDALVQGSGFIDGRLDIEGTIRCGAGDQINFFPDDGVITGGGVIDFAGGDIDFVSNLITDMTVTGDILISPGDTLFVGDDVVFTGPIRVADPGVNSSSSLRLADGTVLNAVVDLDNVSRAEISGPESSDQRGIIGPGGLVQGSGFFDGFLDIQGVVRGNAGEFLDFFPDDGFVTGGGTIDYRGADIDFHSNTVTDMTLVGDIQVTPSDTMVVGENVNFADPIRVADPGVNSNATLLLADGIVLDATVNLDNVSRAEVSGPINSAQRAALGPASLVQGSGFFDGRLDFRGTVRGNGGDFIDFFPDDGVITGGGTIEYMGADIDIHSNLITDMTLTGAIAITPSDEMVVGHDVVFTDPVRVAVESVNSTATMTIADGAALDAIVNLDNRSRAVLRGPSLPDTLGTIGADAIVQGEGILDERLGLAGKLRPGASDDPGRIDIATDAPLTFTPTAELDIGFGSDAAGEFGQVRNFGAVELAGTLRVRALNGFEPGPGNAIDVITGGSVLGEFDDLVYEGPLPFDRVARVFYFDDAVQFVVTCKADLSAPGGIVDLDDVDAFIDAFLVADPSVDFVAPFGIVDLDDLDTFVSTFLNCL